MLIVGGAGLMQEGAQSVGVQRQYTGNQASRRTDRSLSYSEVIPRIDPEFWTRQSIGPRLQDLFESLSSDQCAG